MKREKFLQHPFAKGDAVLYKGLSAEVVSVHRRNPGRMYLIVSFCGPGRSRNFAAVGNEDIELPTPPYKNEDR